LNRLQELNAHAISLFIGTGVGNSSIYVFFGPFVQSAVQVKADTDGSSMGQQNIGYDSHSSDAEVE
jgi:hypothetical protein